MVRNTKGGTGTKGLARKHQTNSSSGKSRLPSCELEIIACVTKMLGNGMCNITTSNNLKLLGHIRNKFRGQHKRHNNINVLSFVLIGLREWETIPKNCDILYIYDEREIDSFHSIPALKLDVLLQMRVNSVSTGSKSTSNNDSDLFQFKDNAEDDELPNNSMPSKSVNQSVLLSNEAEIDMDDI